MHESHVAITGLGVLTPLADSPQSLFDALLEGSSALKEWNDLKQQGFNQTVAARVSSPDKKDPFQRGKELACIAAQAAVKDAGIDVSSAGVFVGTCMGESSIFEAAATDENMNVADGYGSEYALAISHKLKSSGPLRTFGCACASGNYAIGTAAQMIESGLVEQVVAGGVESFSRIAHLGFMRSRAMASERCRPFDVNRNGMQLGEASAFLVLEHKAQALKRKAKIYGYINSLGLSCDAHHPTAPKADGSGMAQAIVNALSLAGLSHNDIDWICAHGTGTKLSDIAESRAIHSVFTEKTPPVTGIKGALGHSLGAASAVEALVCAMAIYNRKIPPTTGLKELDSEIALDIVREPRELESIQYVLNCAYGFGGINSALVLQRS
ncbi:MAG TPA: beta-ketoacyl-[acyl-carrier-protein] synthase family protein [Gammaproteobacteria bacterium]|nr:beta-ketoacyl-[acyl-carrier-protein] synthase family protein [Gammaproteobacteria bacterium]